MKVFDVWLRKKLEWWRTPEPRMILEYLTIEQLRQLKLLFKRQLEEVQKDRWASDFFLGSSILLAFLGIYKVMWITLFFAVYFRVRGSIKSGLHIHTFRKRYVEKARRLKGKNG